MAKLLRQCLFCNGDFYTSQGQLNAGYGKFCRVDCFRSWRKDNCNVKLVCEFCEKEYTKIKAMVDKSKYCSKTCMNEARKNQIEFNCDMCGKLVSTQKSHYDRQENHYCSYECVAKSREGKCKNPDHVRVNKITYVIFICDNCGEEAKQKYDNYNPKGNHHFCNKKCEGEWRSINIIGDKCGQWKGGITKLRYAIRSSRNYRVWRKECFEREDYTCEVCDNRGGYLEVHHVKPFALILDENKIQSLEEAKMCNELWDTENGQVLCKKCHDNITWGNKNE